VSRLSVDGALRLDNRDELLRALHVPAEDRQRLSDLTIVLRAYERWGDDCPSRLVGDFAFVITDERTGRAFGARDPMGVTPFYYRASDRGLAFATRAASIPDADGLPLVIDDARVADVCVPALECLDLTSTLYREVHRLPPGHCLRFHAGSVSIARYWAPRVDHEVRRASDAEYIEAFREIFADAVGCRLSGPTASMLSGGLDSSTIVGFAAASLARARRGPLTTLSAVTDDPGCEESLHVRAMLARPGLDPILIRSQDVAAYRERIESFVGSIEDPFDGGMVLPFLMYAAARDRGFVAVLDGVDGDVVASHEPDILADMLGAGRFRTAVREARGFARFYRGTYTPWSRSTRLLAESAGRAFLPALVRGVSRPLRLRGAVRSALSESILSRECGARVDIDGRLRQLWSLRRPLPALDPRERQARELVHPQMAAALERYHRVAASHGVEARHPLLDRRVVEFCLALPWDQKVRDGWSKRILRLAGEGLVPDAVRFRRGRWVRLGANFLAAAIAASHAFVDRELAGGLDELAPYVDLPKLRALYRRHLQGDGGAGETVWSAAILSSWLRKTRSKRYDGAARANGPAAPPVHPERDDGYSLSQETLQHGSQNDVRAHA